MDDFAGAGAMRRGLRVLALVFVALATTVPSAAQDYSELVRILRNSRDFRVRVQAAFALGNSHDPRMRRHLERALRRDRHEAVRAAAATGLGRLGSTRAIPTLQRATTDRSPAVRAQAQRSIDRLRGRDQASARASSMGSSERAGVAYTPHEGDIAWPRVRYVVVVGDVNNTSGYGGDSVEVRLRDEMLRNLRLTRGLAIFNGSSSIDAAARRQIERRSLPVFRLQGNVKNVERRARRSEMAVRCEVSVMLLDEPERNLRGMLSGAATGSEPRQRDRRAQERRLLEQALTAAVESAMADARSAMARAARNR